MKSRSYQTVLKILTGMIISCFVIDKVLLVLYLKVCKGQTLECPLLSCINGCRTQNQLRVKI